MLQATTSNIVAASDPIIQRVNVITVDLKSAASTLLYTTLSNGLRFVPVKVVAEVTAADTIAVVASLSIGTNATSYNDILAISALTGLSAVNKIIEFSPLAAAISSIAGNTGIYVKVTTGATATTCTGRIHLFGLYV